MTDDEVRQWVTDEYNRSEHLPREEAIQVRLRAKMTLDKRFPNPDICPTCHQKII